MTEPNGGEFFTSGDQTEITWQSSNISNLQIEYTMDDGKSWIVLEAAFDADAGTYLWTTPANNSDQCKIRLTDTDNINVYDKSDEAFNIMASDDLIISPNPASEFIFLNNREEVNMSMYSTTGVCVKKEHTVQPNESVNISDLKSGVYFIQIETLKHTVNKKIIVK